VAAQASHRPSASIVAVPTVKPVRDAASANARASAWSSISVTWRQRRQIRNWAAWPCCSAPCETVDGRWGRAAACAAQPLQQVVSAGRAFGVQDQAEHLPTQIGQPRPAPGADLPGMVQQRVGARGEMAHRHAKLSFSGLRHDRKVPA
jgi:hypothetical protein